MRFHERVRSSTAQNSLRLNNRSTPVNAVSPLLSLEPPWLLLDAAAPTLCAGIGGGRNATGKEATWRETAEEAGVGLFRTTDELLRATGLTMADISMIVFCEGPGSLLGIRLAAMAVRTWQALPRPRRLKILGYQSLALVAAGLQAGGTGTPFHVISDARRETWNLLTVGREGVAQPIRRCTTAELLMACEGGPIFVPENFPHWQPLPADVRVAPYRPQELPELAERFPSLWHETDAPDAFMTALPTYRTWSPTPPVSP